jgi:outer membrane receptor protein involved in Fe transport
MPVFRLCPPPLATLIATLGLAAPHSVLAVGSDILAPTVEVIGVSPIRGLDVPRDDIPSPVQSLNARTLEDNRAQSLPELFNSRLNGVSANVTTGNPYQTDVNYRGFTASPLLGTPQGLSVYQDGVRINEAFGDVVHWDLIPRAAIAGIDLIPGSNPLFGLNTLGGALSITTKSGLTHTGASLETGIGSHGRRELEAEIGRKFGDIGLYATASTFSEDGWRDHSPSRVNQAFAKLSQQRGNLEWDLSYTGARTDLIGNGLLPDTMLDQDRSSIFTRPDNARNQLDMLNLTASYWLDERTRLTGLLYHRDQKVRTLNGDANDDFEDDLDPAETAVNNRTRTDQRSWGAALQWARSDEHNHLALGTTLDRSRSRFEQSSQTGTFDATRGVVNVADEELENRLSGTTRSWSIFVSDTWKILPSLALTGSLRYNSTHVVTDDKLNPVAPNLDGDYTYRKLNPALGAAWTVSPAFTLFANATQGNRAPSPIELGCADPANPCSLPNAMQADPYLKQVVTRTLEAGARGKIDGVRWNATVFRANNRDDILFVGTSTSAGYFTNFGKTRREGIELGTATDIGTLALRADYSYVKATYQNATCLLGENNSTRGQSAQCTAGGQDDEILVQSGDRIPGIPLHSLKLGADWRVTGQWTLSADLVAFSSQYLRGNENNAHRAGTATDINGETRNFLGSGQAAGYTVVNLATRYKFDKQWTLAARINNLFDKRYASAGALAENPFDAAGRFQINPDDWTHESFTAPGAPRSIFVGLSLAFD